MGGVGYVATTIEAPGVIRQTGPMQRLLFGEFDGSRSARGEAFLPPAWPAASRPSCPPTSCARSGRSTCSWSALSGTTTTMRKTIGPIRSNPQTRAFLLDVMREVVAVGRAHGVALPEDYAQVRLQLADDVSPDMTSSMHHDLERGNRLEVRWLAGGVVELGQAKGVPTPLNRAIADILALHAEGGAMPDGRRAAAGAARCAACSCIAGRGAAALRAGHQRRHGAGGAAAAGGSPDRRGRHRPLLCVLLPAQRRAGDRAGAGGSGRAGARRSVAPLAIAAKLQRRFALIGVTGVVRMALSALDMALWDALAVAAGAAARLPARRHAAADARLQLLRPGPDEPAGRRRRGRGAARRRHAGGEAAARLSHARRRPGGDARRPLAPARRGGAAGRLQPGAVARRGAGARPRPAVRRRGLAGRADPPRRPGGQRRDRALARTAAAARRELRRPQGHAAGVAGAAPATW